ncbi:GM18774 [Drosophila sechellia]|uniref:GM18774 n=1 Tax=Drosophila sechellia TaxID=7238 RepID=B4IM67_DROSE|nr:GM18774 [Drosophila sechellia]
MKVVLLNGTEVACLVDTGSDVPIVCQSLYKKLQGTVMQKCYAKTQPLGSFMGRVHVDGIEAVQKFVVIPNNHIENDVILGFDFASQFCVTLNDGEFTFTKASAQPECAESKELSMYNIVETGSNIDASPQYKPMIESMIAEYKPAENNAECPFRHQQSRHSAVGSESIRKEVDVWLQDGIMRKSSSNFASRVVVVKKLKELRALSKEAERKVKALEAEWSNKELTSKIEELNVENTLLRTQAIKWRQRANALVEKSNRNPEEFKRLQAEREHLAKLLTAERAELRKEVKTHIQQAQHKYKDSYDRKRKGERTYKKRDRMAIKRTQFVTGKKLASSFLGPYEVSHLVDVSVAVVWYRVQIWTRWWPRSATMAGVIKWLLNVCCGTLMITTQSPRCRLCSCVVVQSADRDQVVSTIGDNSLSDQLE